jgi:hypothetical protein
MTWNDATGTSAGDNDGMTASVEQEEAGAEPGASGGIVSLRADVSAGLLASMQAFIERHPNWDQYSRDVTRCYLANLFPGQRSFSPVTAAPRQQQP